ncbi:hypothetical protein [Pseudomonas lopnurensis]|nr:hypothetical protein [Pseudomonas lopnurensis]
MSISGKEVFLLVLRIASLMPSVNEFRGLASPLSENKVLLV